jgi:predicted metal-dependent hydrolase
MKKKFTLNSPFPREGLDIVVKKNKKSKNIRLYLYNDGQIVVNIPWWTPFSAGKLFAETKKEYLLEKIAKTKKNAIIPIRNEADYLKFKNRALRLARDRVKYFNDFYNFNYNKIFIKNPQTRWGSCSSKGNLNFSYRIILLPEEYRDYIIVHELCHLGEFNHSKNFWGLVQETIPDYKKISKHLKYE